MAGGGGSSGSATAGSRVRPSTCQTVIGKRRPAARRGQQAGGPLGEQVERGRPVAQRPRQRRAESALGQVLDEQPGGAVDDECGAWREDSRFGVDRATEVVADERLQLEAAQPGAAVVADGDYFLPVPPLRVP